MVEYLGKFKSTELRDAFKISREAVSDEALDLTGIRLALQKADKAFCGLGDIYDSQESVEQKTLSLLITLIFDDIRAGETRDIMMAKFRVSDEEISLVFSNSFKSQEEISALEERLQQIIKAAAASCASIKRGFF